MPETQSQLKCAVHTPTNDAYRLRADRVVLLHDRGSSENEIVKWLRPYIPPDCYIISIRGPICIGANSYTWFDRTDGTAFEGLDRDEVTRLAVNIAEVIATLALNVKHVDDDPSYDVVGHGEGAILALELLNIKPRRATAIAAFGGCIFPHWVEKVDPDCLCRSQILIGHGNRDPLVDRDQARRIAEELSRLPIHVHYHEYDGGHAFSADMLRDIHRLLVTEDHLNWSKFSDYYMTCPESLRSA